MAQDAEGGPGPAARRPTMRDVADAAGVSKALVSMIFRDAPGPSPVTRARVLAVAQQIGYRTNRTASVLARRRSKHLGVMLIVRNAFHAEVVEDVQAAADDVGYEIVLSTVTRTHDERRAIETLLEYRCEALLLLGPESAAADLSTLSEQVPVVVVGRRMSPGRRLDVVRAADGQGLRQVVDHLVGLGHRRITHVDGGAGRIAADRRRGYEQAMRRHGLQEWITTVAGGKAEEDGMQAAELLLTADRLPTAVAAYNDHCAIGVLDRLVRAAVDVPGTVSLAGYDNSPIAQLAHLDLTSVSQEPQEQARLAVRAAVERLDGRRGTARDVVLPPRLMVRGSTAPPGDPGE
jgi:DNA-binding LacI/PurR family transcriptional regulator